MRLTRILPAIVLLAGLGVAPAPAAWADAPAAEAAPAAAPARLDIDEVRLDNGLRIFVLERTASPTFAALYQFAVGGAHDPKGRSGIAHLLEHMMFKGTETLGTLDRAKEAELMRRESELWRALHAELDRRADPFQPADEGEISRLEREIEQVAAEQKALIVKNEYGELVTRAGGVSMNASTGPDNTDYYVQLPANQLELWFRMEAERLLHPVFREFYSERDVVHEERRLRTENTAGGRAREAMQGLLYSAHPYAVPVVGWPADVSRLEREDALAYFRTYYSPTNCTMVFVGDVRAAEIERLAKKYFGGWKPQSIPRQRITAEPEQRGERRRIVEFDAEPQLQIAWPTVPEGHPDQYPLDVLGTILGGLSSSRIDQTIVQGDRIAVSAGSGHPTLKHGGFFAVQGVLRGEHTAAELEQAFEREIDRVRKEGVTTEELERALTAVETWRVASLKSNLGLAQQIASSVAISGSTAYIEEYDQRLAAVTSDDVRRVAEGYLRPSRRNVVEVRRVPGQDGQSGRAGEVDHQRGGEIGARGQQHSPGFRKLLEVSRGARPVTLRIPEIGKEVRRVELSSGPVVFLKEDRTAPSIEIGLTWLGGSNTAPVEQLAPFELASSLLTQGGTDELSPAELEARLDELGMSFGLWIGDTESGAGFWSLSRNFDESFDVALDMLMRPRLDADRLETLRGQYIERMRRRGESPGRGVGELLSHVIYADHPRLGYQPARAEIEAITPEQIRTIWERHLGRDNLYITAVGDFDADRMLERLDKAFAGWRKAASTERVWITHEPIVRSGIYVVEKELAQPAVRIYHQIPVDRTAPLADHAALEILNDILGGSGFRSRLMERLRSDEGLTYGINSGIDHEGRPGVPGRMSVRYQTRKDAVARSITSVLEEMRRIIEHEVGAAEVEEQIEAWRNRFIFRYTNDFSIVSRLMWAELDDRPYDYDRRELEAVQQVKVGDVARVAKQYLQPDKVTIAIFGTLSPEDRAQLSARPDFKVLTEQEIFKGGYAEITPAGGVRTEDAAPEARWLLP